ncbi:acyl-CoA dehydrogenase [Methylocapsa sp. D3K7]|uniref:acyl-CoA dehydrogenase n=1 Tax=Methylocapsa sp. D3K7 TaxID=3041435 RepID=UPI00244E8D04|nr:acyl-CoA dehydrogenase [Methylocapsa sp. D3K7]WGJ14997.1 acyl-CoA dehydrogenase [Methylocapsa sp. D3K7]
MTYRAPVADILFSMVHEVGIDLAHKDGVYADLAEGFAEATLTESGKFAENILAPLNRIGDQHGAKLNASKVTAAPGFAEAYRRWTAGGWNAITGPSSYGGTDLPVLLNTACIEIWNAANMAFSLCPLLTLGAIEAMQSHATEALKTLYLGKLVSGEWAGTMNLTEPQAGSDLGGLKTRAERQPDGTYKLVGSKIFITYGEHDMTDNIVHFVLARLPNAPKGTRGISLFLVPKFLVNADGTLGARNDVYCASLEHKLGIHASPTCTMVYGDHGGAVGFLIGEENKGLACMFTMMNSARLNVGVQGVAIAERAFQQALAYAKDRRQGHAAGDRSETMSPIVLHPDVARMLMTMKAMTAAARAICLLTAESIDRSRREKNAVAREHALARASLLTPIAKAFSTDIGNEVASLGIQVHGGMGYIEESGAAQFLRDARIAAIYEGTNGIQAIDLVQRKLGLSEGDTVRREIADMRASLVAASEINAESFGDMNTCLVDAVDSLERATLFLLEASKTQPSDALAGATPYLRLFALARGGTALAKGALAAQRLSAAGSSDPALRARIATARFFAENIATGASGLERAVTRGAGSVHTAAAALDL